LLPNPENVANRSPSILIVEDEKIVAKDLEKSLRRMGYEVAAAVDSAAEAAEAADERCPDLVLMDIHLKGELDGIEAARLLRRRFDVPIIYLTAFADEGTVARARSTDPHGYILKPFKEAELRSSIEIALHKHQTEKRLRERERWFSTTLRAIGDAVIAVDPRGHITFMNLAAERLTGKRLADVEGKRMIDAVRMVEERTGAPVENPIVRALTERKVVGLPAEAALVHPQGDRPVEDSAAPIVDDSGKLLGAVVVFRDVREQRRLQQQVTLADRLASLGTLAAGVAHEINNPLAVILGNAAYVRKGLDGLEALVAAWSVGPAELASFRHGAGEMGKALEDLQDGADRASRIVADLRTFGRPQDDSRDSADVRACAEWALRVTGTQLRARAQVRKQLQPVPAARGSATRIGQVIVNLLINAAQAIKEGHPEDNEIVVSTGLDDPDRVVIEVRDTGAGIAPSDLPHIFEPFFTTKAMHEGTGLGLSICHGIVGAMGGRITVDSAPGRGSTFRVSLPQAPAHRRAGASDG
jgi:two-component system, cell cycle sensor histidine kinase and response regulator CckA